jgi:glutamate racemase
MTTAPIGVFDSGYGGLTVLKEITRTLPEYDYLYLGDNARAPYGTRDYDTVYRYTLEAVNWFFNQGCELVILACNTASAKALRTIQQNDLPALGPDKRVLGVIRPTAEVIGQFTKTGHIGILGTPGTIQSNSYKIEIRKFFPHLKIIQEACPMWVPLVENLEQDGEGADYFVKKHLDYIYQSGPKTDCLLLACTHYPLLLNKINRYIHEGTRVITQGNIVAESLAEYLKRHPEMAQKLSKKGKREFYTTGDVAHFDTRASLFYGENVAAFPLQWT